MFSRWLSVYLSVHLTDMMPVSEADEGRKFENTTHHVALNLCRFFYLGSPNQGSSILRKTRHAPNTAMLQYNSSIRTNKAIVQIYL